MKPNERPAPKWGAGHASAMFRQGLSELRGAFYPESNVAQPPQYGLYGTKTPGEVADSRRKDAPTLDEEPRPGMKERLQQDPSRADRARDEHTLDRE